MGNNSGSGALLRTLNVWWLNFKNDYGNSPVILSTANQGMQSGGNETTASEFEDIAHHPGPCSDVPSWISPADCENHRQRQANEAKNQGSDNLLPAVDRKEVPLKTYTMKLGTSSIGNILLSVSLARTIV